MTDELTKHEQRQNTQELLDRLKEKLLAALEYETEENIQTNRIGQAKALDYLFKNMMAHGIEHDFNPASFLVAMRAQSLFHDTAMIIEKCYDQDATRDWHLVGPTPEVSRRRFGPLPWFDEDKHDGTQRRIEHLAEREEGAENYDRNEGSEYDS